MTVLCMWHKKKLSRIDLSKQEEVESGNTTSQQFTKLTSLDHISNIDDYERTIVQGPQMASYSNSCFTIIDTETKENNPLTSLFKATSSHYEYNEISIKETENNITQDSNKSTQLVRQDSDQRMSNKNDFSVKDLAPSERNTHEYDKQRQLYSSVKKYSPKFSMSEVFASNLLIPESSTNTDDLKADIIQCVSDPNKNNANITDSVDANNIKDIAHSETEDTKDLPEDTIYGPIYSTSEINTSSLRTVPNLSTYNIKKI